MILAVVFGKSIAPLSCYQGGTWLSGCPLDASQGQESTMREAHPTDPSLSLGAAILGPPAYSSNAAG